MSDWIISSKKSNLSCIVDVSACNSRVQEARLFAALLESGWALKVNPTQLQAIGGIAPFFSIKSTRYVGQTCHNIKIEIEHQTPLTKFGHVERTLIFPEWIFSNLRTDHTSRGVSCSFEGYPTRHRVQAAWSMVEKSGRRNQPIARQIVNIASNLTCIPLRCDLLNKAFNAALRRRNWEFRWTCGGREISNKVYDVSYWERLQNSKTVYCPAGDFGWTYRFYEALLAGAIPIIDSNSSLGFVKDFSVCNNYGDYTSMQDSLQTILDDNFKMACRLVTARDELNPQNFLSR